MAILRRLLRDAVDSTDFDAYERREMARMLEYITLGKESELDGRELWELVSDETGTHPSRVKLSQLARAYRKLHQKFQVERRQATQPKAKWAVVTHPGLDKGGRHDGTVRFTKHLQNRDEFDAHLNWWGSGINFPSDEHRSVTYFTKELAGTGLMLVCHKNGGYLVLKDDLAVQPSEWAEMIETGRVPEEWLR
jgi:hypothetical protein